ncbi:MAG: hypothetical protein J0H01_15515 [Rhizobiales bacterium]|nr:hypothetical protein [Hyphomicrobiales bacterium]
MPKLRKPRIARRVPTERVIPVSSRPSQEAAERAQIRAREAEAVASEAVREASVGEGRLVPAERARGEHAEAIAERAVHHTDLTIERVVDHAEAIAERAVHAAQVAQEKAVDIAQLRATEAVAATDHIIAQTQ